VGVTDNANGGIDADLDQAIGESYGRILTSGISVKPNSA
jgi:hypothetical protein